MSTRIVATGFNTGPTGGDLTRLAADLARMERLGASGAELAAWDLYAVADCRLIPERVAEVAEITSRHRLRYSLHAPIAINLMDEAHGEIMHRATLASLELAAAIDAKVIVLHPGRVTPQAFVDRTDALYQMEIDRLGVLADRAQTLGVAIAYENMSPNPRIIAGEETSYAIDPRLLAAQLTRLSHDAVMACLDVSHAQQGANLWGFDLLEAAHALAPWVGHIHFSDSTGVPTTFPGMEGEFAFMGTGDMHAPPGYGRIDFAGLAARLPLRQGTASVIELKPCYRPHGEAATLAAAHAFADAVNAHG